MRAESQRELVSGALLLCVVRSGVLAFSCIGPTLLQDGRLATSSASAKLELGREAVSPGGAVWSSKPLFSGQGGPSPGCSCAQWFGAAVCLFALGRARRRRPRSAARQDGQGVAVRSTAPLLENTALVFVKPHAATQAALQLVPDFLQQNGIRVVRSGHMGGSEILDRGIIDAHYAAIAGVGMLAEMQDLRLSSEASKRFSSAFGVSVEEAVGRGEVYSAATAMAALNLSASELLDRCLTTGYEKLGPGLYAARLESPDGRPAYVFNGFYARLREKYVTPKAKVHWFVVSFDATALSWSDFRGKVIGSTNPEDAPPGSLRAKFLESWQALGLDTEPDVQDNGVHASAGPLEALRERSIWLGDDPVRDPLGAALYARNEGDLVTRLCENPVLELIDGRRGTAFDLLEDMDTQDALVALAKAKFC